MVGRGAGPHLTVSKAPAASPAEGFPCTAQTPCGGQARASVCLSNLGSGEGVLSPMSQKGGVMASNPGTISGPSPPCAVSFRLSCFLGRAATVWKYFLSNSVLFSPKTSFFLFGNKIETHRRQSRGLSGKAPSFQLPVCWPRRLPAVRVTETL